MRTGGDDVPQEPDADIRSGPEGRQENPSQGTGVYPGREPGIEGEPGTTPTSGTPERPHEKFSIKLQPTYHAQLQEALIFETDANKLQILADALEKEAAREFEGIKLQQAYFADTQKEAIKAQKEIEEKKIRAEATADTRTRRALYIASLINFVKWAIPAVFAILIAWWMVTFYRSKDGSSAQSLREILILMIGGALGWIAQARSDLGNIAQSEDDPNNKPR